MHCTWGKPTIDIRITISNEIFEIYMCQPPLDILPAPFNIPSHHLTLNETLDVKKHNVQPEDWEFAGFLLQWDLISHCDGLKCVVLSSRFSCAITHRIDWTIKIKIKLLSRISLFRCGFMWWALFFASFCFVDAYMRLDDL